MKVKDLIIQLLDKNMNAEIRVGIDKEHFDETIGRNVKGYLFQIEDVKNVTEDYVEICFEDWRGE